jgi:tetratricopeptide (TPR) repeat protein
MDWIRRTIRKNSSDLSLYFGVVLVAVTLLIYQPAWRGKPIMDDITHLVRPEDRSLEGLARLWFHPSTNQQYHPLVDTVFWIEDNLWSDSMLGYHVVNILLHASSAILLLKILQKLEIRGAWLATAIFAIHPVQVESVAHLVQLKNTLSGIFFFSAALVYLKFDETRDRRFYWVVLGLLLVGSLAKTVVALFPVAILIGLWWKRGRLECKRDVQPLLLFIVIGIAAGICTAWMELEFSSAKGEDFEFSMVDRCLIAGRAFCFYLGRILWPTNFVIMYPHWKVDAQQWSQYFFPAFAVALITLAWVLRRRWRSLWAGILFFTVMLFPMLGFFNMRIFRFRFVADHFEYLPIIGIAVPVSAGIAAFIRRKHGWLRAGGFAFCFAILTLLSASTWKHSKLFRDAETYYRAVVEKNPDVAMSQLNLGIVLLNERRYEEAKLHLERALQLQPNSMARGSAYAGLGNLALAAGSLDQAVDYYTASLSVWPDFRVYNSIGGVFHREGKLRDAVASYEKAIELQPESPVALTNLAWILATAPDDQLRNGARAVELSLKADRISRGRDPLFLHTLAAAYAETGDFSKAIETAHRALNAANQRGMRPLADQLRTEVSLYEIGIPYRESRM